MARLILCKVRTARTFSMEPLIKAIRSRIRRLSTSNFVSPGPRVPIPPPKRDKISPLPIIRGRLYCSCANSTCNFPSLVRARWAKISKIKAVLSRIRTPITCSIFLCCAGVSSSSKMHRSIFSCCAYKASSCTFPFPIKNAGSGLARR